MKVVPYQPGFEEDQARISSEKPWAHFRRVPADILSKLYTNPSFDPDSHLFLLDDNIVVGYISTRVINNEGELWLPVVKKGYESYHSRLMDEALHYLESQEVTSITTTTGLEWESLHGLPEQYGFSGSIPMIYSVIIQPNLIADDHFIFSFPSVKLKPYFPDEDDENLISFYEKKGRNIPEIKHFIATQLHKEYIFLYYDNDTLLGILRMLRPHKSLNTLWMRCIDVQEDHENRDKIIQAIFRFFVEYGIGHQFDTIDFFMNKYEYQDHKYQYRAIRMDPKIMRWKMSRNIPDEPTPSPSAILENI
ncbi:MAG: hypothetical protein INQ03_05415 [Candidatus Heimdallarchaeota archaeon]|nr:hypothetical protein [Candidatus Heimdallarchaeota archaeon]